MNDENELTTPREAPEQGLTSAESEAEASPAIPEEEVENVISVWKGSSEEKFFRRRWFEGYTQYETLDADGKTRMHNVYTGMWYTQQLDKKQQRQHRLIYTVSVLLGFALLLFGSTRYIPVNARAYGAIPPFAGMLAFGWMGVGTFNEFTIAQRRTIGEYRSSSTYLKQSGLVAAICGGVSCLLTLVFIIVDRNKVGLHLLAAGSELLAAALGWLVRSVESKVVYEEKMSKDAGKYTM